MAELLVMRFAGPGPLALTALTLEPAETGDDMRHLLDRVRRGEPIHHFETVRQTSDGRLLPVFLSISPLRDESGTIIGASTIGRDITERKKSEAERDRLLRDLQTALAEVKTLRGLLPICSSCKKIRLCVLRL